MVIDIHVHIQPWDMLLPDVLTSIRKGRKDLDLIQSCIDDPGAFLRHMDEEGIEQAALINYSSPDLMGFTDDVNRWVTDYCRPHRDRLIAVGSVHPRYGKDPGGDARRLLDAGIRILKVHPPHQLVHAND